MKNTTIIYLIAILSCPYFLSGQTESKSVISTAGQSMSTDALKVDFTVGEISVNTYSIPGLDYFEGFHHWGSGSLIQSISLEAGWNLVSFNVLPPNDSVSVIFSDILPVLLEVKNTTRTYNPDLPDFLNSLHRIKITSGYWVNVTEATVLDITGYPVDPSSTPITLVSGWNLVAYLNRQDQNVETTSILIGPALEEIKDMTTTFNPSLPGFLNTLSVLKTGSGYWMKVNSDVTFFYHP